MIIPRRRLPGLTIKQPWAWAVTYGGMDVLSKTWFTYYRGDFWLHAAASTRWDSRGAVDPLVRHAWENIWEPGKVPGLRPGSPRLAMGAVVAVAELIDVHSWEVCEYRPCSRWGKDFYWHWQLGEVWPLREPWPARGWLGWGFVPRSVDSGARHNLARGRHER
jgi:hypothetical protein